MTDENEDKTPYQDKYEDIKRLTRFLQDDGDNVFDKNVWTEKPPVEYGDIDALLDNGAFGLEWFRTALVRYHRVWDLMALDGFDHIKVPALPVEGGNIPEFDIDTKGDPNDMMRYLEGHYYDTQRGMNLASLSELSKSFSGAALGAGNSAGTGDIAGDLQSVAKAVPGAWEGQGGEAASNHLVGFHAHADQQAEYVKAVALALNGLPDVLRQIVVDKANFVRAFASEQMPVAGHAMHVPGIEDPVSNIITVAAGNGTHNGPWNANDSDEEIAKNQLHLSSTDEIQEKCKDWLKNHFGIAVREAFIAFVHQCELAHHYIKQAYKPVMDLLDSQDTTPFPKPPGDQGPDQPGQPIPNQPPPSQPGPGPAAPTVPTGVTPSTPTIPASATPTTPASANPAAAFNPSQILSSLTGQGGQAIQQGLSQALPTLQQGLGQIQNVAQQGLGSLGSNLAGLGAPSNLKPQLTDVDGPGGAKELANLSVLGGNVTVTQAPDGTVSAEIAGADGKSHEYSFGIENGLPFVREEPPEATESAQADSEPKGGSSPGEGGSASGVPGGSSSAGSSAPSAAGAPPESAPPQSIPGQKPESEASGATAGGGTSANTPSQSGAPGPGMPGPGPAGGGRQDGERPSNGLTPQKPLWTEEPGEQNSIPNGPIGSTDVGPDLATVGPLEATRPTPIGTQDPTAVSPASYAVAPEQAEAPAEPASRPSSGVKIEVDTGEAK